MAQMTDETTSLSARRCQPCQAGTPPLARDRAQELMRQLSGWELNEPATEISRTFRFKNYYETMAFVNAVAWVSHREDHHPDVTVGYKQCRVEYMTHAIGGLSENDFICAAKLDKLFEL